MEVEGHAAYVKTQSLGWLHPFLVLKLSQRSARSQSRLAIHVAAICCHVHAKFDLDAGKMRSPCCHEPLSLA